ncbi:MAG: S-layer homology domain-containing protein, partial [Oscillospiraceae bacterium]|nr:S-layer homology domain-containing protein [Oscillospiraceae bacterium]
MKRLLSLLLALCIMISLLPNVSFAAEESQVWSFGYEHSYDSAVHTTAKTRYSFENFKATSLSKPWAFVDGCYPKGYAAFSPTSNNFFKTIFEVDEGAKISYPDGCFAAVTFALKVKNGGEYTPSIVLGGGSSLPQVDVYLTTQTVFEALTGDTYKDKVSNLPANAKLTTVDCYDQSVASKLTLASLKLKSGEGQKQTFEADTVYYLTLVSNEPEGDFRLSYDTETKAGKNILNMCLRSFTLTPEPIAPPSLEYSDYYLKYNFAVTDKTLRLDSEVTEEMTKSFWSWGESNKRISTLNAASRYIQLGTYKNDWVALKLNVPVAGLFKTKLTYGVNASTHTGAGPGKLYILPGNTENIPAAIGNGKPIGEVNFLGTGASFEYDKEQELADVTFIDPGEYYLVFSALGYDDRAHNMYPTAIEFIGGEELAVVSVFVNKEEFVIEEGETDKLTVTDVHLSDYSEASEYELSFKSSDERVATVDENGNITAVSSGSATITVTVSYNGTVAVRETDVLVIPQDSSKYRVIYDLASADAFETATYADTYNFWQYAGENSIEINVPVAGGYSIDTGAWQGTIYIGDAETDGYFVFPEAGRYSLTFDGSGIPEKIDMFGGKYAAPMGVKMSFGGTIVSADEILLSDGSTVSANGLEFSYSIDDFSVTSIDEATGKLLPGKNGGETIARASVKYDGLTVYGQVPVSVSGADVSASSSLAIYSFNTASSEWKKSNYTAWDDEYGGATTWNIKGITYADTDGWGWHMSSNDSLKPTASMWTGSGGATIQPGANGWATIKLKIPAAGRYWATLVSSKSYDSSYGSADVFFVPLTDDKEELEASLTDENKVATLNCRDESLEKAGAVTDELGAVYARIAGDYLLVFRDTGENKKVIPRVLTLNGMNGVRYADFKISSNELEVGDKITAEVFARLLDGTQLTKDDTTFIFASSNEKVATFIDGEVEAVGDGVATLTLTAIYGTQKVSFEKTIKVTNTSEILGVEIVPEKTSDYVGKSISLSTKLIYEEGIPKQLDNADVTYEIVKGNAEISDGVIIGREAGKVKVTATYNGMISTPVELEFKPGFSKSGSTYYTEERVAAARENIKKYSWAKSEYEGTIRTADNYLPYIDKIFGAIAGKGLPKSYKVGYRDDPDYVYCRYCGANAEEVWGGFTYSLERMWKIQCPACKRLFPSNDFELLYSRGLVNGNYDVETARKNNAIAVANGEKDALVNELYPELYNPQSESCNIDPRTGDAIDGKMWGVDDGWGYHTGRTYDNGIEEVHTYVSYFAYKIPNIVAHRVQDFGEAYIYTGDAKYGRAGAILLDRIADVYPDAFTNEFFSLGFATGGGGDDRGKFTGRISDAERADVYALAADALYPYLQTEDPELIKYLSAKEKEFNYENKKTSAQDVWNNWKDNLLWESFKAIKTCHLLGNTGYHQSAAAGIMLVLDEEPRSSEILDWLYTGAPTYGNGVVEYDSNPGGNVAHNFLELIDRDGMGNEASPSYNLTWVFHFNDLAKYIRLYTDDPQYDLYQNPKFMQMYRAAVPIVLTKTHHAQIGDSGSTATIEFLGNYESVKSGFYYMKDTPVGSDIAEYIYLRNGDSAEGLHYDIFTENPESMQKDIEELVKGSTARESEMLAGYGFVILRSGDEYGDKALPTYKNNMRDFWMWFGVNGNWSHAHQDALNLGIEAYGLNMAPDLGYSESSGSLPSRWQWVRATISHNTVVVNEKNQVPHGKRSATPLHFDDSGDVKVMDIDASEAYDETSIYRRTFVMVNAGDDVSYGVDFFRIKGGNDHMYSFHSQSDTIYETEGLGEIRYQTDNGKADGEFIGTYAGADVPYGPDPSNSTAEKVFVYKSGYTWMKNIRQAFDVNKFSIDYNVTDFRKAIKDGKDLHMRLTMLNDFELSEVAMTLGHVPPKLENKPMPEQLEYMLARRTSENGESLDSLFTTVYEPYKGEHNILSMDAVQIVTSEKTSVDDMAKAVRVLRTDGRCDYIVYATNNKVIYTVSDENVSFDFRGFVGVYSVNESGKCIYSYVHDGDIIGENISDTKQYIGRVTAFTNELSTENYIWIKSEEDVKLSDIVGKYMFIDNDMVENGVYKIESAEADGEVIKLGIGMSSVLRSYKDASDISGGFIYNIGKGQKVTIPISNVDNFDSVFSPTDDVTASAGSSVSITVSATSADGRVKYIGTNLPRGASINFDTGVFTWKPDSSQIGENHVAITARDEFGRESTIHFTVTVYGSTTGKPESDSETADSTTTPSGNSGGSAGGGGVAPDTENSSDRTDVGDGGSDVSQDNDDTAQPNVGNGVYDVPNFTDLTNHSWAADAINALADDGIIKGTTASTFSPESNITRADFALLLVRAFGLESDNTENFADVSASDYFASELAVARNTGIVSGI